MTRVAPWVQEITEEVFGKSPLYIGKVIKTTEGKTVQITGGQYWGEFGLSNFWDWREILSSGRLSKTVWCGYGYISDDGKLITNDKNIPAKRK